MSLGAINELSMREIIALAKEIKIENKFGVWRIHLVVDSDRLQKVAEKANTPQATQPAPPRKEFVPDKPSPVGRVSDATLFSPAPGKLPGATPKMASNLPAPKPVAPPAAALPQAKPVEPPATQLAEVEKHFDKVEITDRPLFWDVPCPQCRADIGEPCINNRTSEEMSEGHPSRERAQLRHEDEQRRKLK